MPNWKQRVKIFRVTARQRRSADAESHFGRFPKTQSGWDFPDHLALIARVLAQPQLWFLLNAV